MNFTIIRNTFASVGRHPLYVLTGLLLCALAIYLPVTGEVTEVHVIGLADVAGFIIAATLIGPEWRGTVLQLILVRPVRRTEFVLSRFLGGLLASWALVLVPSVIQNVIAVIRKLPVADRTIWISLGNHFSDLTLMTALLVFLGSFARSYEHVLYYWVIRIGVNLITTFQRFPGAPGWVRVTAAGLDRNLFPLFSYAQFQTVVIFTALGNATILLLAACWIASRRSITYAAE